MPWLVDAAVQDVYKRQSWMSDLYAQGLLDAEWLTHDFAQYKAKTRRTEDEIVGVQTGWGLNNIANPHYAQLLPLKGPDGDQFYAGNSTMNKLGTSNYNVLSITASNPDLSLIHISFLNTSS